MILMAASGNSSGTGMVVLTFNNILSKPKKITQELKWEHVQSIHPIASRNPKGFLFFLLTMSGSRMLF